jgi:hypothetical protein
MAKPLVDLEKGKFNSDEKHEVQIINQHTPTLILPMAQQLGTTTITADTVVNAYTITVASASGFAVGQHIRVVCEAIDRYYFGEILSINSLVITLDTPIDNIYCSGAEVTISNTNMAVDGSTTPVIFTLRTGTPSIPSEVDITKMLIICTCSTGVDLNKFGDLAALTKGVVFRSVNSEQFNIFNVKTNACLAAIAYDWTPYVATNPAQGINGFATELTFAGQNKIGVSLRVQSDGNLEMVIQDDLTDLVRLIVMLEGHVVLD